MELRQKVWIPLLAGMVGAIATPSLTQAQEIVINGNQGSVVDAYTYYFFGASGPYHKARSFENQFDVIFGTSSFPENRAERDAKYLNIFHQDALQQQMNSGVILRTPDLASPFTSSVATEPCLDLTAPACPAQAAPPPPVLAPPVPPVIPPPQEVPPPPPPVIRGRG